MTNLYRRTMSSGFTLVEVIAVMLLVSLLVSLSVPSFINYRKSSEAKSLSDHIKTDLLKVYSMSRRFSAFCSVFYTPSSFWSRTPTKKLDLITSNKRSFRFTTYSPLIARCAEDSTDLLPGANLLYNENIVNRLPEYLFLSLNKRLFGFTPRGLSNGSLDTLLLVGQLILYHHFCLLHQGIFYDRESVLGIIRLFRLVYVRVRIHYCLL